MYATNIGDQELTLGVSGMLWKRSLVMYDTQTESLWSHILGRCMRGPLEGKQLTQIPALMTDWQGWSRQHPDGKVLWMPRTTRTYTRAVYDRAESYVLGIAAGDTAKAWSFDGLIETPVINDEWKGKPTLVSWDSASASARLFSRVLNGRELTFHMAAGRLQDRQTGSFWNPSTGLATDGQLQGTYLKALPAIVSFIHSWESFYPDGLIDGRRY